MLRRAQFHTELRFRTLAYIHRYNSVPIVRPLLTLMIGRRLSIDIPTGRR